MKTDPPSSETIKIDIGVRRVIRTNKSFKYVIETFGGSIIEGTVTANTPIAITSQGDIKNVNIIIDDDSAKPVSLVE